MRFTGHCLLFTLLSITPLAAIAVDSAPGVPVSVLITVEAKRPNEHTFIQDDVRVEQDKHSRPVIAVKPLQGTPTQMLLMIDDSAGVGFDSEVEELKKFVSDLPANIQIGVGYMRNGLCDMAAPFTNNHAQAADSIRLAVGPGGEDVSPYDSLTDAAKKWPKTAGVERREVVMISSGIEGLGGGMPPENPYVNAGIESAQKAGILVYAIYNPSYGHAGHSFWGSMYGQNFLSQLTDETGGELYGFGMGTAVSFIPYLSDILARQAQQYEVTFSADPEKKSGLRQLKVLSDTKGISLAAPSKVFVPAGL